MHQETDLFVEIEYLRYFMAVQQIKIAPKPHCMINSVRKEFIEEGIFVDSSPG
jgi:hypothetical protein